MDVNLLIVPRFETSEDFQKKWARDPTLCLLEFLSEGGYRPPNRATFFSGSSHNNRSFFSVEFSSDEKKSWWQKLFQSEAGGSDALIEFTGKRLTLSV